MARKCLPDRGYSTHEKALPDIPRPLTSGFGSLGRSGYSLDECDEVIVEMLVDVARGELGYLAELFRDEGYDAICYRSLPLR